MSRKATGDSGHLFGHGPGDEQRQGLLHELARLVQLHVRADADVIVQQL